MINGFIYICYWWIGPITKIIPSSRIHGEMVAFYIPGIWDGTCSSLRIRDTTKWATIPVFSIYCTPELLFEFISV